MEPKFLIVNTADGWNDCDTKDNLKVDGDSIIIMRDPVSTYVKQESIYSVDKESSDKINDISIDECGNLYIALTTFDNLNKAIDGSVLYYNRSNINLDKICSCQSVTKPLGHIAFKDPVGITIGKGTIYVVDKGDTRLYSISRQLLQIKWTLDNDLFGDASGIVTDGAGNIFVLNSGAKAIGPEAEVIRKISPDGNTIDSIELASIKTGIGEPLDISLLDIAVDETDNLYVLGGTTSNDLENTPSNDLENTAGNDLENAPNKDFTVISLTKESGKYVSEDWITSKNIKSMIPAIVNLEPSCIVKGPGDELLVGEAYKEGKDENGKTLLRFTKDKESKDKESLTRIFAYNGTAHKILFDPYMNLFVVSGDCKNIICLTYGLKNNVFSPKNNQALENTYKALENTYSARVTKRFDSGKPGTTWHRLKLDFDLPGKMVQVQCRYYASDDLSQLDEKSLSQTTPLFNPQEALFDNAIGRYLWIEIRLLGTEFDSPRIRSIKVFFPRISYLRYLPAIYQEDEASSKFLERFLSIFESFFTDIEENIESIPRYTDSGGVPSQYLNWLGSWLSISIDKGWPENKKRELIAIAPELFKKRGTRQGLIEILKMFLKEREEVQTDWKTAIDTEICVLTKLLKSGYFTTEEAAEELKRYIKVLIDLKYLKKGNEVQLENYLSLPATPFGLNNGEAKAELRKYLNNAAPEKYEWEYLTVLEYFQLEGMDEEVKNETYGKLLKCPLCFLVIVNSLLSREELKTARRIVDSEKPAHTTGNVVDLKPWIYLGGHTYLGINTILSRPKFILEEASLGKDAVLTEPEEYGHLELKSRLDIDTLLS